MNNNSYIDPANNDSLAGTLNTVLSRMIQDVDGLLPAKIISYDRTTNRARVQILIAKVTTNNEVISRPVIASVPVLLMGGGDFMISYPLKENDLGWVLANDRDISLFLENYEEAPPNTYRVKNFSDAIFIPDVMTDYSIDSEDSDKLVIQSKDGSTKITIGNNDINIVASTVNVNASTVNTTATSLHVPALSGLTIGSGTPLDLLNIYGSLHASGSITATNIPPAP